ncbi:MAG: sugar transferase, partial [Pseudomonadota bacterium]
FDILASALGLIVFSPFIGLLLFLVWRQDGHDPIYKPDRVGRGGRLFKLMKMRSMIVGADKSGVESTSATDNRITPLGQFIRRYKLDELTQLWNVLTGEMSLVGPRPNTLAGVAVYTSEEQRLLLARPGITDFSSIVFSNEGEIIEETGRPGESADDTYDRVIRPWKSRLGLMYVEHSSVLLDVALIFATIVAIISKPAALRLVRSLLKICGAEPALLDLTEPEKPLTIAPPPGATL